MVTAPASEILAKTTPNGLNALIQKFGFLSLQNVNKLMQEEEVLEISDLIEPKNDIRIRARLSSIRNLKKMAFLVLRDENHKSLQAIALKSSEGLLDFISKNLTPESVVVAKGNLVNVDNPIISCSISDMEFVVDSLHCISKYNKPSSNEQDPENDDSRLTYQDLMYSETSSSSLAPSLQKKLNRRVLDLRTPHCRAIMKSVSIISNLMRSYFLKNDFIEIFTPKIIASASEGGAEVFRLKYYGKDAFLAQSPQLFKQMALCGDLRRVFSVGPVFRAENSNTHRHLSEFTGFDFEMSISNNYHEILHFVDGLLRHTFDSFFKNNQDLLKIIANHFGEIEEFKYGEKTHIFHYRDAIKMLREANVEIGDYDDIGTTEEKLLGKIIKDKYDVDYYIIDKFPLKNRAFYTMEDTDELGSGYSNSYDIFFRGEEILSGAQRISDASLLRKKLEDLKIDSSGLKDYLESLDQGVYPHGGGGFGLERIIMFMLGLKNIRYACLFPRDPTRLSP